MRSEELQSRTEPLVVYSHVTPWGFLVALPLAVVFAYLGALTLDTQIVPGSLLSGRTLPFWLFAAILLGFALFLFLIGVSELASYLKPSVEVVMDNDGLTVSSVLNERRITWADIVAAEPRDDQLMLRLGGRRRGQAREVRLQFARLAVDPALLVQQVRAARPDLMRR